MRGREVRKGVVGLCLGFGGRSRGLFFGGGRRGKKIALNLFSFDDVKMILQGSLSLSHDLHHPPSRIHLYA